MVVSTLGRKVLQETSLPESLHNAEWVELKLQKMKINGLVAMINSSKRKETSYIDGYMPKYKWSTRPDGLVIAGHIWVLEFLQVLGEDFPWGYWDKLITITVTDMQTFHGALYTAVSMGKGNLAYAWAVFQSKKTALINSQRAVRQAISDSRIVASDSVKTATAATAGKWNQLRERV